MERKSGNGVPLGIVLAGMFVNLLNVSIINVMLPVLMDQFTIAASTAQWLSTGFLLATGIVIALVPFLAKTFQYKTLFVTAMAALVVGSVICAAAPAFAVLLVGRLIQALGYGILLPLAMMIVLAITPKSKLGSAMGVLGIAMMLAPAIGPTLAGAMITLTSWRVLFWAMAVIGLVVGVNAVTTFSFRNPTDRTTPDMPGIILVAAGLSAVLYGASTAGKSGWGNWTVIVSLIGGVALLAVFAVVEWHSQHPLLDLRVFTNRNFSATVSITMILQMAFYGGLIMMPLYFQNVQGFSGLKTGLLLLPGSVLIGVVGIFAGKLYDKIGLKPLAITGTLIMAAAAVFLAQLTPGTGYGYSLATYAVFALGVALVTTPITTAAFTTITPAMQADASTLQNMLRQIAGAIGTAVLISTMTTSATSFAKAAHDPIVATSHGINAAFILTIVLCLATAAASVFLTSKKAVAASPEHTGETTPPSRLSKAEPAEDTASTLV